MSAPISKPPAPTPKLIVFDLDDTLVDTTDFGEFRGIRKTRNNDYTASLIAQCEAKNLSVFEGMDKLITKIRSTYKDCKIVVFTKSPKLYASTILGYVLPGQNFDDVIAYEDCLVADGFEIRFIGKPDPAKIKDLMSKYSIKNPKEVFIIGDSPQDISVAFKIGAWACGVDFLGANYNKIYQVFPEIVAKTAYDIWKFIENPQKFLPLAESIDISSHKIIEKRQTFEGFIPRVDPSLDDTTKEKLNSLRRHGFTFPVYCCGRYFKSAVIGKAAKEHKLSCQIFSKFDGTFEVFDDWIDALENAIESLCKFVPHYITVIPQKDSDPRRLELVLQELSNRMKKKEKYKDTQFKEDVFKMTKKGNPTKEKGHLERFLDLEEQISINNPEAYKFKRVVVIDDVLTTGSTMFWARKLLKDAGVNYVLSIAIAKAVP